MISHGVINALRRPSGLSRTQKRATTTSQPWFKDGLQFKCTGCGKCCTGPAGHIWITKTDAEQISSKLKMEPKAFLKKYARWIPRIDRWTLVEKARGEEFDCIFLENGKTCAIYDVRPTQCKTYPYWPAVMESQETWNNEQKDCEGINRPDAPLATYEQVAEICEIQKEDTKKTYEMGKKPVF